MSTAPENTGSKEEGARKEAPPKAKTHEREKESNGSAAGTHALNGHDKSVVMDAALVLAKEGRFVFPVPPGTKQSYKAAKYSNGYRWGSTRDPEEIRNDFTRWPNANVGIDCGESGIVVIEADTPKGHGVDGIASLKRLQAEHGQLPETLRVISPSGSEHYYFNRPAGLVIKNTTSKFAKGVDVRGEGGMVICPPSIRKDGQYRWVNEGTPIADMPAWLIELAKEDYDQPIDRNTIDDTLADIDEVAAALAVLPNDDPSWSEWNKRGMAIWAATAGSNEGFNLFDEWSKKWTGYNAKDTNKRWKAYTKYPPAQITARSIFYWANEVDPSWQDNPERDALGAKLTANITSGPGPEPEPQTPKLKEIPPELLNPPGLVGAITDWITDTALYPQRGLALGAALVTVGTAAGRHIAGPNKCGTHLYLVGLAPTGTGKNHPLTKIGEVLIAAGMRQHVGPSQFISMPSVINFLVRSPLSVCAMDEFGSFLKRINSKKASGFEGAVSGMLRTAWGASFTAMSTPEWAQKQSELIYSPALSIYAVSTNRDFYNSLEGADIINGVLNRFLIIETASRPDMQEPLQDPDLIPAKIVDGIKRIYESSGPLSQLCQSTMMPQYRKLSISPDAEEIHKAFRKEIKVVGLEDEDSEALLARTAENALRLATIVTIGLEVDCIEADMMTWSCALAKYSTSRLIEGAGLHIADSEYQAMAKRVKQVVASFGGQWVKRATIGQRLKYKYKGKELDGVIADMRSNGDLVGQKIQAPGGGPPGLQYRLP
jgi:hypothetical protein